MADAEERAKAERLAAGKKKFEQLKKQKEKSKKAGVAKKKDDSLEVKDEPTGASEQSEAPIEQSVSDATPGTDDKKSISEIKDGAQSILEADSGASSAPSEPPHTRQPSSSLQSKMRSSSFRRTSVSQGPLSPTTNGARSPTLGITSPDGETMTDIYRKQAARLDELEKENRRLAKEASEAEGRWKGMEAELEELREASPEVAELRSRAQKADVMDEEISKLRNENTSLTRQNAQLQSASSKSTRHTSSPSQGNALSSPSDLQAQLESKSSTIESMEMEISTLRSQLSKGTSTSSSHSEQVSALEGKLDRAERAAGAAQRELLDVRKSLERASEKAVRDGSERTSAETKIRTLGREAEESKKSAEEAIKRLETLGKKLAALTTLHKDADTRRQASERQHSLLERDVSEMRRKLATLENDNLRLREERDRHSKRETSGDDGGVDELEDEERQRLESKVRSLEGEVYELRRGVWKDKRREMSDSGPTSPGSKFDDIDLNGGPAPWGAGRQSQAAGMASGFTNAISSGFSAFTGGGGGGRKESDSLLDDDMDEDFDEDAFRRAQEDESKQLIERVKEIKRGLKDWESWRMDIVDCRVGAGVGGEIFDV